MEEQCCIICLFGSLGVDTASLIFPKVTFPVLNTCLIMVHVPEILVVQASLNIPVSRQISTKNETSAKVVDCLEKYIVSAFIVNPLNNEVLNKLHENYVNLSDTETLDSCE